MDQTEALGNLIAEVRHWAECRARVRHVTDSKKARPEDLKQAQRLLALSSARLERAVRDFNRVVQTPARRQRKPIDWVKTLGVIANVAGGLEKAVQAGRNTPIDAEVIDVEGHTVR
jgi:hypothetical protein